MVVLHSWLRVHSTYSLQSEEKVPPHIVSYLPKVESALCLLSNLIMWMKMYSNPSDFSGIYFSTDQAIGDKTLAYHFFDKEIKA